MFSKLCPPAKFYFLISSVSFILMLLQNIGSNGRFNLGIYSCPHSHTGVILILNALYIVAWTWILNLICTINKTLTWVIVLFPFIMLFIALGAVMIRGMQMESMCSSCTSVSQFTPW
jgi:hypothetical protein